MSSSARGPQTPAGGPFVMHLEKVCRLIEMGQTFTVELHPHSDLPAQLRGRLVRRVGIHILDGGQVTLQTMDGQESIFLGLSLANYKRIWRCWQNGVPTDQARGATAWR